MPTAAERTETSRRCSEQQTEAPTISEDQSTLVKFTILSARAKSPAEGLTTVTGDRENCRCGATAEFIRDPISGNDYRVRRYKHDSRGRLMTRSPAISPRTLLATRTDSNMTRILQQPEPPRTSERVLRAPRLQRSDNTRFMCAGVAKSDQNKHARLLRSFQSRGPGTARQIQQPLQL